MYFSQQALDEMSDARAAIGGKYESLLMKYVMLPLKDATAKEYATQGFPRRLGVMAHCIHNVFKMAQLSLEMSAIGGITNSGKPSAGRFMGSRPKAQRED
jgi:hypothetical protein